MMGPIEQSQRAEAVAARSRLMNAPRAALQLPVPVKRQLLPPVHSQPVPRKRITAFITSIEEIAAPLRWKAIVKEVCEKHGITFGQVLGRQRSQPIVKARFEAYFRLSEETGLSLPQIGRFLGGKDHTSVLHGIRKHKQRCAEVTQQSELSTDEIRG